MLRNGSIFDVAAECPILLALFDFFTFDKNQPSTYLWVYFWSLCSAPSDQDTVKPAEIMFDQRTKESTNGTLSFLS